METKSSFAIPQSVRASLERSYKFLSILQHPLQTTLTESREVCLKEATQLLFGATGRPSDKQFMYHTRQACRMQRFSQRRHNGKVTLARIDQQRNVLWSIRFSGLYIQNTKLEKIEWSTSRTVYDQEGLHVLVLQNPTKSRFKKKHPSGLAVKCRQNIADSTETSIEINKTHTSC